LAGLWRPVAFLLPWITQLMGWYSKKAFSRAKIDAVQKQLSLSMDDFQTPSSGFRNFNDFFTRKPKPGCRPFDPDPDVLVSPSDCRLFVIPNVDRNDMFQVKHMTWSVQKLAGVSEERADKFRKGAVALLRLAPGDCHRFYYPADGELCQRNCLKGLYDSVNPIALAARKNVLLENVREVSELKLSGFGEALMIEVGAFGIAAIVQTHQGRSFCKMTEKGYFEVGGSTIVLVFQAGAVSFDQDLLDHSFNGFETLVKAGERIGCKAGSEKAPKPAVDNDN
jgi:phosphatidylserine decarboxylase